MTQTDKNDKPNRPPQRFWATLSVFFSLWLCIGCKPQAAGNETKTSPALIADEKTKATQTVPELVQARDQGRCPSYRGPTGVGVIGDEQLGELSGLVASAEHEGIFWVHNDSGDRARIYALNRKGEHVGTFELGVKAHDWEDIALRTNPNERAYLYIADTGDNFDRRNEGVLIHRFREPKKPTSPEGSKGNAPVQIKKVDTMHLSFPDSPQDNEALLVDPWTDQILLVTKTKLGWPKIYSVDSFEDRAVLKFEGTITPQSARTPLHLVTAGDVSPDGHWIILRTYLGVYLFHRSSVQSLAQALQGPACVLSPPVELQGEAIAFSRQELAGATDEGGPAPDYFTVAEGTGAQLFFAKLLK